MRTASWLILSVTTLLAGVAGQGAPTDPELILSERFRFTSTEVDQARQGTPIVKVQSDGEELVIVGAIKLTGTKERLADWLRNVEHFRTSAELGVTHVVAAPPAAAAFAGVTLDPSDLAELQQCRPDTCAIRLSGDALTRLQRDVAWGSPNAASQANEIVRAMLLGYTTAYLNGGNAAVAAYDAPQAQRSYADDMRALLGKAKNLTDLAPEFAAALDGFPAATPAGVEQVFYWSATPAGSVTILTLHHLLVYRPRPNEVWIADKNVYSSRYFDAGVVAIGLYDAPQGGGYYALAGSRVKVSKLGGMAATVLRRQIQRSASSTVKMYLEWLRESLAQQL